MTEIFATLGPSCYESETLKAMLYNGLNGMRLNMSHASLKESSEIIENYHKALHDTGVNGELLIDLQGGELRLGALPAEFTAADGSKIQLSVIPDGNSLPVPREIFSNTEYGDRLLIDDGKILIEALEGDAGTIQARVLRGGVIHGRKSIKIEGKELYSDILNAQDKENILLSREFGVTAIMQPFVTGARELVKIREFLNKNGLENIRIFSKIESITGVENLDEIIPHSDMIVIARGDLGNAMPLWELPGVQKTISRKCISRNKPFMVVTQMLTSMINSPVPTRAEVSDIYNAVLDGAGAVMVTNETAVGSYPVEVIEYLTKTVKCALKFCSIF